MFRTAGIIIGSIAIAASLAATTASALEVKYLSRWTSNNKGTWGT